MRQILLFLLFIFFWPKMNSPYLGSSQSTLLPILTCAWLFSVLISCKLALYTQRMYNEQLFIVLGPRLALNFCDHDQQ